MGARGGDGVEQWNGEGTGSSRNDSSTSKVLSRWSSPQGWANGFNSEPTPQAEFCQSKVPFSSTSNYRIATWQTFSRS